MSEHSEWAYHGSRAICRPIVDGEPAKGAIGFEAPLGVTCDEAYLMQTFADGRLRGPFPTWECAQEWLTEPVPEVDGP